jgi:hypothetical protein
MRLNFSAGKNSAIYAGMVQQKISIAPRLVVVLEFISVAIVHNTPFYKQSNNANIKAVNKKYIRINPNRLVIYEIRILNIFSPYSYNLKVI